MTASKSEVFALLSQFNPWWMNGHFAHTPSWKRDIFGQILRWLEQSNGGRALLLTGARQVGKTTLFLQAIEHLLSTGTPPANIIYVTLDHPLLKIVGLDALLSLWREFVPQCEGVEYLFLDEIQESDQWQTWLKLQVDFQKQRRVAATGSAVPLIAEGQESGVGRWQTLRLATLSFREYTRIRQIALPPIPDLPGWEELSEWTPATFARTGEAARPLVAHFHEYLLRGGFPRSAIEDDIPLAQQLLREDILDRALRRDLTAWFGVRRVQALEQLFLYLCLHGGGIFSFPEVCGRLEINRPTVASFLDILEAAHLIYRLLPSGGGKQVLRVRPKIYLTDPAIAPSVLLQGKSLLENPDNLARAVETAVIQHLFARHHSGASSALAYWHGKQNREVDIICRQEDAWVPWEIKYRSPQHTGTGEIKGLIEFCQKHTVKQAFLVTRDITDFSAAPLHGTQSLLLKIPAPLACYWS